MDERKVVSGRNSPIYDYSFHDVYGIQPNNLNIDIQDQENTFSELIVNNIFPG